MGIRGIYFVDCLFVCQEEANIKSSLMSFQSFPPFILYFSFVVRSFDISWCLFWWCKMERFDLIWFDLTLVLKCVPSLSQSAPYPPSGHVISNAVGDTAINFQWNEPALTSAYDFAGYEVCIKKNRHLIIIELTDTLIAGISAPLCKNAVSALQILYRLLSFTLEDSWKS